MKYYLSGQPVRYIGKSTKLIKDGWIFNAPFYKNQSGEYAEIYPDDDIMMRVIVDYRDIQSAERMPPYEP